MVIGEGQYQTKQYRRSREPLSNGISIEESTDIVFDGIMEDKLVIGPKSFKAQLPGLHDVIRTRTENILNELNPSIEEES